MLASGWKVLLTSRALGKLWFLPRHPWSEVNSLGCLLLCGLSLFWYPPFGISWQSKYSGAINLDIFEWAAPRFGLSRLLQTPVMLLYISFFSHVMRFVSHEALLSWWADSFPLLPDPGLLTDCLAEQVNSKARVIVCLFIFNDMNDPVYGLLFIQHQKNVQKTSFAVNAVKPRF